MTEKQIRDLRPAFKIPGGMSMVDWFEVREGGSFYILKSGLNHADGESKSPFHYFDVVIGKGCKKTALKNFTEWWNKLNGIEDVQIVKPARQKLLRYDASIYTPPFRLGRKQLRAVLDSTGKEVVIFPIGGEIQAQLYVNYLNRK